MLEKPGSILSTALMHKLRAGRSVGLTCGRSLLNGLRGDASACQVLVHKVQQHGGHIVLAALVPVAVDGQPVAQVPHFLTCKNSFVIVSRAQ